MNTLIRTFGLVFCISLFYSCEQNQRGTADAESGEVAVGLEADDDMYEKADYLVSAHKNSQLQIALGEVADQRSNNPQVQEFARRIAIENRQIQNNITELASAAEIHLEPALTPEYVSLIERIQSYSGPQFDSAFINVVIEEHEEDVDRFKRLASQFSNPIIRNLITDNLEILRRQQNDAEQLKDGLNID